MKVIVPNCVEVVAAFAAWSNQFSFLSLVFRDQNDRARVSGFARGAADSADDVLIGIIKDALRRIEAESIEVEFFNPVAAIGNEKFADWF
jgi:hypothetical protein